jgi:hypothetical protein
VWIAIYQTFRNKNAQQEFLFGHFLFINLFRADTTLFGFFGLNFVAFFFEFQVSKIIS